MGILSWDHAVTGNTNCCSTNSGLPPTFRKFGDFSPPLMSLRKGRMGLFSQQEGVTSRSREQWWLSWGLFAVPEGLTLGLTNPWIPITCSAGLWVTPKSSLPSIFSCWQHLSRLVHSLCVLEESRFLSFDATIFSYTLSSLFWDEDVEGFPPRRQEIPAVLKEPRI